MIHTYSSFFYGHTIDSSNRNIDFNEGSGEVVASLRVGDYTLTTFIDEVARALNEAGSQTYTVTVNRATRKITISATSNFSLLVDSGSHAGTSAFGLIGFDGEDDLTGNNSYTSDSGSGYAYDPQVKLQGFVDFDYNKKTADSSITISSDGNSIQTISNGDAYFMTCDIKFINNYDQNSDVMKKNTNAVSETLDFLEYITQKRKIEFIPDIDTPSSFETCVLDKTDEDSFGTSFKLKEMTSMKLVGYYQTGVLVFRRISA